MKNQGFTLIEILVVVLIIGILAAIAVPKYQESVERSIMQEAITNLKTIAQANDVFMLTNNRYATATELDKLDVTIPGATNVTRFGPNRIATKYFLYSSGTSGSTAHKAVAHRLPIEESTNYSHYYLFINTNNNKLGCWVPATTNKIQTKLCNKVSRDGSL